MPKNMGVIDRIVRVLLAGVVAVLYLTKHISGTLAIVLLIVGAVFLLTAIIGTCPLYLPFKISTKKV